MKTKGIMILAVLALGIATFFAVNHAVFAQDKTATTYDRYQEILATLIDRINVLIKQKETEEFSDVPELISDETRAQDHFKEFLASYGTSYPCKNISFVQGHSGVDSATFDAPLETAVIDYFYGKYFVIYDRDPETNNCSLGYTIITNTELYRFQDTYYTWRELHDEYKKQKGLDT